MSGLHDSILIGRAVLPCAAVSVGYAAVCLKLFDRSSGPCRSFYIAIAVHVTYRNSPRFVLFYDYHARAAAGHTARLAARAPRSIAIHAQTRSIDRLTRVMRSVRTSAPAELLGGAIGHACSRSDK